MVDRQCLRRIFLTRSSARGCTGISSYLCGHVVGCTVERFPPGVYKKRARAKCARLAVIMMMNGRRQCGCQSGFVFLILLAFRQTNFTCNICIYRRFAFLVIYWLPAQ